MVTILATPHCYSEAQFSYANVTVSPLSPVALKRVDRGDATAYSSDMENHRARDKLQQTQ